MFMTEASVILFNHGFLPPMVSIAYELKDLFDNYPLSNSPLDCLQFYEIPFPFGLAVL